MTYRRLILKTKTFLIVALILFLGVAKGGIIKNRDLRVIGTVVAYIPSAADKLLLTDVNVKTVLIVRIDRRIRGRKTSRYIRVNYEHVAPSSSLPKEVFEKETQLRLLLRRNTRCDGPLPKHLQSTTTDSEGHTVIPLTTLTLLPGAENENIPTMSTLRCYTLVDGDFALMGKSRLKS